MKPGWCTSPSLSASLFIASVSARAEQVPKFSWKTGRVEIGDRVAVANLPKESRYRDPKQSKAVLEDLWGNPRGSAENVFGMIFPSMMDTMSDNDWGIVITYEESGYVKDDDADKINCKDLLSSMRKKVKEENPEREKAGYGTLKLVGWAAAPRYDKSSHKLFWAKELKFGNAAENTLNYNFRILGRKGGCRRRTRCRG